jgi:hypothetical protein
MHGKEILRPIRELFAGTFYQRLALCFCFLLGLAMIVNNQLEGEGFWFWYATLFHQGAKLYQDLHLPLQPLIVLEMNAWIGMFGIKCLVTEIPSVLHVLVFSLGMFLILRESDWPDWQKAIVLASAFLISVDSVAYRFDDFHVVMDSFTFYSMALLLLMPKTAATYRQFKLAALLGILSGLGATTRFNDGGALLVATGICLLILTRRRKLIAVGIYVFAAAVTAACMIALTGDSFSAYAADSIVRAAGAKGGAGSILAAPVWLFCAGFYQIYKRWWLLACAIGIVAVTILIQRRWKLRLQYLVALQLGMAGLLYGLSSPFQQEQLRTRAFFLLAIYSVILANYLLVPLVGARLWESKRKGANRQWDCREILILIPLAELASFATSNAGKALGFFSPVALLLLLAAVIQPFRSQRTWANASLLTMIALMGLNATARKIQHPYDWLYYHASPMFQNRQWYHHPIYGPMYMPKDDLRLMLTICADIEQGNGKTELLSIPFSNVNYFCGTPPWHGYVQTFFDTITQSTVEHLTSELNTSPPQWIVYQRQVKFLRESEVTYHGGQRLPQRDLDELIMQKVATKQWQLVDRQDYGAAEGWYVIRTRR